MPLDSPSRVGGRWQRFFKGSLRMTDRGTSISPLGRGRRSEARHLRKLGFQPSFEASGFMIDRFASLFASVRGADGSG